MNESVSNPSRRRFILLAGAVAVFFCLLFVIWIGFIVRFVLDVKKSTHDFPLRHTEAREAVEFVYSYHAKQGRWPTEAEVQAQQFGSLSNGWQYSAGSGIDGAPVMSLHGPYHMLLYYHFEPPEQGTINDEWSLSFEGDKKYFQVDEPYVAK